MSGADAVCDEIGMRICRMPRIKPTLRQRAAHMQAYLLAYAARLIHRHIGLHMPRKSCTDILFLMPRN